MYIPEFWCGVFATIVVEIIASVAYSQYQNKRRRK